MRTEKQKDASRNNGAKSRGPVTPEGKAISSQNAATHGIYSRVIVLQNERHDLYVRLREEHIAELRPVGTLELNLVEDIVNSRWRLARLMNYETAALDLEMDRMRPEVLRPGAPGVDEATRAWMGFENLVNTGRSLALLHQVEGRVRRTLEKSMALLLKLQAQRRSESSKLPNETGNTPGAFTNSQNEPGKPEQQNQIQQNEPEPPSAPPLKIEPISPRPEVKRPTYDKSGRRIPYDLPAAGPEPERQAG